MKTIFPTSLWALLALLAGMLLPAQSTFATVHYVRQNATGANNGIAEEGCIPDSDCDGVPDNEDRCPGGDDSVDNNNDGQPDCAFPPPFNQIIPAWKCGHNKVLICHNGTTICKNYNSLANHIGHGDYLGGCGSASCSQLAVGIGQLANGSWQGEEAMPEAGIEFAPNPTSEAWNVAFAEPSTYPGSLYLHDAMGKLVWEIKLEPFDESVRIYPAEIDLQTGIYWLRWQGAARKVVFKKN